MRRFLLIVSFFLAMNAFAQEQLLRLPQPEYDPPKEIRYSPLYGKTIIVFGDSYVQNAANPIEETWHYKLARKYNMEYHNWGRNGSCVAYEWKSDVFGPPMYERYTALPDTADYVIVIGGHNDAVLMHRYGEGTEFFRSKLDILCQGLKEKFPTAKICFVTPWNVPQPMYKETAEAIEEVCGENGIPVFNSVINSGITPRFRGFRSIYFQSPDDVAHLNAKGHDLFLPRIEPFLLGL